MVAALATARMTAFRPGQSPPPVIIPILFFFIGRLQSCCLLWHLQHRPLPSLAERQPRLRGPMETGCVRRGARPARCGRAVPATDDSPARFSTIFRAVRVLHEDATKLLPR